MKPAEQAVLAANAAPAEDSFQRLVAALVLLLLLVDVPSFQAELRFFSAAKVINSDGTSPVLQDSKRDPSTDLAFQAAAARLPAGSTCVISVDAWNEDYFRAAYIMMPLRIWPYSESLANGRVSRTQLAAALAAHHATCLLLAGRVSPPTGMTRVTTGAYSLFMARSPRHS